MKGISAVIATLLLLVITIGLATTVYFYVNNIASRQTSKVVEVQGYCSVQGTTRTITLVITNLGTDPIVDNLDLKY
ncbi:MAG: type IV pilin, partial [Candidatus Aenigmatarchaeota archaeon]